MKVSFLDIVSIIIIVFCVFNGVKKGFVKSFFSFLAHIGSLIGAFMFCKPLGLYISERFLNSFFEEKGEHLKNLEYILKLTEGINIKTAEILGKVIAFVLIYIGVCVLCFVLSRVFNPVFKLPVLKQFNGLLGGSVSLLKGLFIIFILFTAITAFQPFFSESELYKSGLLNTENAVVFNFMNEKIVGNLIEYFNI